MAKSATMPLATNSRFALVAEQRDLFGAGELDRQARFRSRARLGSPCGSPPPQPRSTGSGGRNTQSEAPSGAMNFRMFDADLAAVVVGDAERSPCGAATPSGRPRRRRRSGRGPAARSSRRDDKSPSVSSVMGRDFATPKTASSLETQPSSFRSDVAKRRISALFPASAFALYSCSALRCKSLMREKTRMTISVMAHPMGTGAMPTASEKCTVVVGGLNR